MDAAWTPEVNRRRVDWLDLTPGQFVTGPRAWRAARAGTSDPDRHVVAPDLGDSMTRGWVYIAHNAIHDPTGGPPRQVDVSSRALRRLSTLARMGTPGRRPRTFGIRDFDFLRGH